MEHFMMHFSESSYRFTSLMSEDSSQNFVIGHIKSSLGLETKFNIY